MKERQRHKLGRKVFTLPGDMLIVTVNDRETKYYSEERQRKQNEMEKL